LKLEVIYSGVYYDDCHPFNKLCANVDTVRNPDELKEKNSALIIWGGQDINPEYYKRPIHPTTHPGGMRDKVEWGLIQRAIEMQIPIFGVCRGAQFLCAAAGGWLIQNVHGHAGFGGHDVVTKDGKTFKVNSIHHQMMNPEGTEHELVAWSPVRISERVHKERFGPRFPAYGIDNDQKWTPPEGWNEPEFIYFPKVNGYAVQWHPESMAGESEATQYILNYITKKEDERANRSSTFPACQC
jgi:gamma-glutamyl-gamma-aminobutyrate hydrolase PuuD